MKAARRQFENPAAELAKVRGMRCASLPAAAAPFILLSARLMGCLAMERTIREAARLAPLGLDVVCSWCGDVLVYGSGRGPVSHGICAPCKRRVLTEMKTAPAGAQLGEQTMIAITMKDGKRTLYLGNLDRWGGLSAARDFGSDTAARDYLRGRGELAGDQPVTIAEITRTTDGHLRVTPQPAALADLARREDQRQYA